jgi:hypothetical protein
MIVPVVRPVSGVAMASWPEVRNAILMLMVCQLPPPLSLVFLLICAAIRHLMVSLVVLRIARRRIGLRIRQYQAPSLVVMV